MKNYDVAAFIWPSYTGREPRAYQFWEKRIGEWQSVLSAESFCDEQILPRKPLWGTVDEADPKVMEFQINEALRHGVNTFIYDWYWYDRRPFLEQCLDEGFLCAENNKKMKFYLMWANHNADYLWDKRQPDVGETIWYGSQSKSEFDRICRRVIDMYFVRDNYYKIDGCPVFMIYDLPNFVRGIGGVAKAREALDEFRGLVRSSGFPGLHIQGVIYSENAVNISEFDSDHSGSSRDLVKLLGIDSVTHYQYIHFVDFGKSYPDLLKDVAAEWERIHAQYDVPYYPHVSIGWDNTPRFNEVRRPIARDNTPENVKKAFEMAKSFSDNYNKIPLITINSWNEWTEMSYLEPDDVYGYGYLEAVRDVFGAADPFIMNSD
ncbi:MAG: glycoside hydrolase family 99-like domain-containing protein [Clostridia bacterium]|nr:glycoside hydrolase family 99-like domain-containing protein [Clostridia bacterium]